MQLKDLIGFQIINLDNDKMVVQKGKNTYTLVFDCDDGECCGHADIANKLLFNNDDAKENPIITNISVSKSESEYGGENVNITLFGAYKPLARINANTCSDSGWCYGATITVNCKALEIDETISVW